MSKLNESLSAAPGSIGFPILQDWDYAARGLELHQRSGLYAVAIQGRADDGSGDLGHYIENEETRGDMSGFLYWDRRDDNQRAIGSWREVFPAIRTIVPSSGPGPVTPGSGGSGGPSTPSPNGRPKGEIGPNSRPIPGVPGSGSGASGGGGSGPSVVSSPAKGETFSQSAESVYGNQGGGGGGNQYGNQGGGGMIPETPNPSFTFSIFPDPVLPITGQDWETDVRYVEKNTTKPKSAGPQGAAWPRFPGGHIGLMVQATDEDEQIEQFHPTDPRLIAAHRGAPMYGTFVCDLTSGNNFSDDRYARLQTLTRVVRTPSGKYSLQGNRENSLALNIGLTGAREAVGGLWADKGGRASWYGLASVRDAGPIDVTDGCKHRVGRTGDGEPISPVHFSHLSLFRNRPDQGPLSHDGPLEFEEDYPAPPDLVYPVKVHLGWNPLPRYLLPRDAPRDQFRGMWSWWTTTAWGGGGGDTTTPSDYPTPQIPPGEPPDGPSTGGGDGPPDGPATGGGSGDIGSPGGQGGDPPGGGPETGGGDGSGASTGGGNRDHYIEPDRGADLPGAVPLWPTIQRSGNSQEFISRDEARTHLESVVPALSFRPQLLGDGLPDITTNVQASADDVREYHETAPVIVRMVAFGQQTGGPAGGDVYAVTAGDHETGDAPFNYTQEPGTSRSQGGTAPGIVAFIPPETDATDIDEDFAPDNVTLSESFVTMAPGTRFAFGAPDVRSGKVRNGVSIKPIAGGIEVYAHDANGDETIQFTVTDGQVEFDDGINLKFGTSSGSQIGESGTELIGFHGSAPTAQDTGWSVTGGSTDRALDAGSPTAADNANVLGTLINTLIAKGIIGA